MRADDIEAGAIRMARAIPDFATKLAREEHLIEVGWHDRLHRIDPASAAQIANVVIACALDNYYDRTHTGIPYGLSAGVRVALAPIVERHLAAVNPRWREETVNMPDEQRAAFRLALVAEAQRALAADGGKP